VSSTPLAAINYRESTPVVSSRPPLSSSFSRSTPVTPCVNSSRSSQYVTPAKGSRTLLIDRPSHWATANKKTSKLSVPVGEKSAVGLKKPPLPSVPKPLVSKPLYNVKNNSGNLTIQDISFQPSWMRRTKQLMDENITIADVQLLEGAEDVNDFHRSSQLVNNMEMLSSKQKSTRVTSAPKTGSLRWKFSKIVRENDSLNNRLNNQRFTCDESSIGAFYGLHDPRNRVESTIQLVFLQYYGYFEPFQILSGKIKKFTESKEQKRKLPLLLQPKDHLCPLRRIRNF
jgi:hypothetical protein